MRFARRCIALGFLAGGLIIAACGRDFDSLFVDGPLVDGSASPGDAGQPTGSDGSVTGSDAGLDAEAGPTACTPTGTCESNAACDAGSGLCTTVCNGCPCNCGTQTCPAAEANKRCDSRCSAGAECDVQCLLSGPCDLTCDHCTSAKLRCEAATKNCTLSCTEGSSCEQTCTSQTFPCTMICAAGARCLQRCNGSGDCTLDCADGTKKSCAGGVSVCGQACP